jgi:hypothetical protein
MLQNHPVLRERVLGAAAISALILGGLMAMDTLVTGGWQWSAAAAGQPTIQQDDLNQQWNEPAPGVPQSSPVGFAANAGAAAATATPAAPGDGASAARALEGAAKTALTAFRPASGSAPLAQATPRVQAAPASGPSQSVELQSLQAQTLTSGQLRLPAAPIDEAAATARFNQIVAEMQQAQPQRAPTPKLSDGGDGVDRTNDPN